MRPAILLHLLAAGLCGAASGCEPEPQLPAYRLDGITVFVGFDDPICGGTFDWIESRLRWLVTETGLPASTSPISFYWLRDDLYDHCPTGGCTLAFHNTFYSSLNLFSHELVHGHLTRFGVPRPWIAEGMAMMLEDIRWDVPDPPVTPSMLLAAAVAGDLDFYLSAASFVRYLRDRYGMSAVLELYAALDRIDAADTPAVFREVLGDDWDAVEDAYLAAFTSIPVGSIHCDFPEVAPRGDVWTFPVDTRCDEPTTIGPFFDKSESFEPFAQHSMTLEIHEAGTYTVTTTTSARVHVALEDCDAPEAHHGSDLTATIELQPGRKRLEITADIADEAIGELVLRGPLTAPPE